MAALRASEIYPNPHDQMELQHHLPEERRTVPAAAQSDCWNQYSGDVNFHIPNGSCYRSVGRNVVRQRPLTGQLWG
jgi:hypothetical protein